MVVDTQSPLYLHPSDGANSINVDKLTGPENYRSWRRSMEVALSSKRKLGFVLGTVAKSATDAAKGEQWDTCNSMVISWLFASLSEPVKKSVLYLSSAKDIWLHLEQRFSLSNGSRKYKINRDLYALKQQGSVNDY